MLGQRQLSRGRQSIQIRQYGRQVPSQCHKFLLHGASPLVQPLHANKFRVDIGLLGIWPDF